jgi:hypothetical protein
MPELVTPCVVLCNYIGHNFEKARTAQPRSLSTGT